MNQNRNGVNGETSDAFVETIRQTAPGSTDLLSITGIPEAVTAGASETFTVTALSPNGGTDTSYLGTIQFSSTDPQAGLAGQLYLHRRRCGHRYVHRDVQDRRHPGDHGDRYREWGHHRHRGQHHRSGRRRQLAENHRLSEPLEIAGTPQTFTVTAYDAYGNVATGYTGTVQFTSSDGRRVSPPMYTVSPEQQGTFTFVATFETLGTQTITATDTVTSSITGTASITVVVEPDRRVHQAGHDDGRELDRDLRHAGLRRHRQRGQPFPAMPRSRRRSDDSTTWAATTTDPRALRDGRRLEPHRRRLELRPPASRWMWT